jgi:glutamate carboxypeptidase
MNPAQTLSIFQNQQDSMLKKLQQWVEMESPTTDKPSVDRFGEEVARTFRELGMSIEIDKQTSRGNHLVARWTGNGPKILLIGHIDTVWELGTLARMPFRKEGELAFGPGIFDMKGGIVVAYYAFQLLKEHDLHHSNITLLLNTDEEEGSVSSQNLIEREAKDSSFAFVLEPAGPDNSLKTKRRGVGDYQIRTFGVAAHAGVEPEKGVSAVEELARHILTIQSWNKERPGISANVDVVQGGTRSNVIPAEAHGVVDVRCDTPEDKAWLEEKFRSLKPHSPKARLEVEGGVNRPPLVRSEAVLKLYGEASEIGSSFGYPMKEYWTGGGSDGNFTSSLGVPTLDGLGVEGAGAHADHEQIIISSLSRRANLLYHLIRKRLSDPATS